MLKNGKKIDKKCASIIDDLKEELLKNPIVINQNKKDLGNNPLFSVVSFDKWKDSFQITLLPTKTDIEKFNEREQIRQDNFKKQLANRILGLTSKESVKLIDEVFASISEKPVRNYVPGKPTRDGGVDFTVEFYLDRDYNITKKYGEWFEVYGQLKHLKGKMSDNEVRDLSGAITRDNKKIEIGMVISSRGYSPDCETEVSRQITSKDNKIKKIFLEDINFIVDLMIKHNIGLEKFSIDTGYFIDEEWWDAFKLSA